MVNVPMSNVPASNLPASAAPLRIGVIGCTTGRARFADALLAVPALRIAALADADLSAAQAWARSLPGKPAAYDVLKPILAFDPPLDAVLLALPLETRAAPLAACCRAGLPVCCSLPLTPALRETDALLESADTNPAWILPALPRRFDPALAQVGALLESGAVGELRTVRCDRSVPALPAFGVMEDEAATPEAWRTLWIETACQTADLCRLWLGDALTVSADIEGEAPGGSGRALARRGDVHPVANFIVTHENGQATHHIARARSIYPAERYTLTGATGRIEWTVSVGEKASPSTGPSLVLQRTGGKPERLPLAAGQTTEDKRQMTDDGRQTYRTPNGNDAIQDPRSKIENPKWALTVSNTLRARAGTGAAATDRALVALLHEFAACLQSGRRPAVGLVEARAAVVVVHGAMLASRESVKLSLPVRNPPAFG